MKKTVLITAVLSLFAGGAHAQSLQEMDADVKRFDLSWLDPIESCPSDLIDRSSKEISPDYESCEQGLSECVEQCRRGDEEKCFSAAATHELLENDARAHALYARACKLGVDSGCTNFAARLRYREQGDELCISNTFLKMCNRNEAWGCAMSSVVVWQGEGLEIDAAQATAYVNKTCEIDPDSDACDLAKEIQIEIEGSGSADE